MIFDERGGNKKWDFKSFFSFFKILFTPKIRLFFLNNHFISPIQQKIISAPWPFITSGENNWFSNKGEGNDILRKYTPLPKSLKDRLGSCLSLLEDLEDLFPVLYFWCCSPLEYFVVQEHAYDKLVQSYCSSVYRSVLYQTISNKTLFMAIQ